MWKNTTTKCCSCLLESSSCFKLDKKLLLVLQEGGGQKSVMQQWKILNVRVQWLWRWKSFTSLLLKLLFVFKTLLKNCIKWCFIVIVNFINIHCNPCNPNNPFKSEESEFDVESEFFGQVYLYKVRGCYKFRWCKSSGWMHILSFWDKQEC